MLYDTILYWVLITRTQYNIFLQIKILSFRGTPSSSSCSPFKPDCALGPPPRRHRHYSPGHQGGHLICSTRGRPGPCSILHRDIQRQVAHVEHGGRQRQYGNGEDKVGGGGRRGRERMLDAASSQALRLRNVIRLFTLCLQTCTQSYICCCA